MIQTDTSGKWVPIEEVMKLLERIAELEACLLYTSDAADE